MKLKSILLLAPGILICAQSIAQTHVKTNGKKYTLVEEATGEWCGYCPDGAQVLEQTIEPGYPRAIVASWHNGDPLQVAGDPYCTGTGYITGFPLGTVNRSGSWTGGIQQNRGQWAGDCTADSATTPTFDVSMTSTYDTTSRVITIAVTGKALAAGTGNWRINALITEDSITSANRQHSYLFSTTSCANGQPCWFNGQTAGSCGSGCWYLPMAVYAHMNVVNAILATGASVWGDVAFTNPTVGQTITKNYTYTIPATSKWGSVKVIGMVQKFGATTADRAIENSIQAKVRLMWKNLLTVQNNNSTLTDANVYPNPAGNYINVECPVAEGSTTNIVITNIIGQVVFEKQYTSANSELSEIISLGNFSNGMYLMNITNNGEKVTRKFTVSK